MSLAAQVSNLLKQLHPDRAIHPWHRAADQALVSFAWPKTPITTPERFGDVLVLLYWHIEAHLLGVEEPLRRNAQLTWDIVRDLLKRHYGPSGYLAALDIARTGVEGGRSSVARALAREMAEEYATRHIRLQVNAFWNLLNTAGRLAAGDEVLARLSSLLPSELVEGAAARVRADLREFLAEYPQLLLRIEKRMPAP